MEENKDVTDLIPDNVVPQSILPNPPKRRIKIRPTVRQIQALKYYNEGMSMRGALKKAGYSKGVYEMSTAFLKSPGVKVAIESMQLHLENVGLTQEKFAGKIAEFVDAKGKTTVKDVEVGKDGKLKRVYREIDIPDYKTQVEGVKLWDTVNQRINSSTGNQGMKKRELTITEFISGEDEK